MGNKTLFCFVVTPFQASIIGKLPLNDYNHIYLVNLTRRKISLDDNLKVIDVVNSKNTFLRILQVFKYIVFFRYYLSLKKDLCVAHHHHEFINRIFFSKNTNEILLYQDGVANFYDPVIPLWVEQKIERRLNALRFFGFGSYVQCSDFFCAEKIGKVYTYFPLLLSDNLREKGELVQVDSVSYEANKGVVLFIDQPVDSYFSKGEKDLVFRKIKDTLAKYRKVYVKRHHDGNFFGESVDVFKGGEFEVVTESITAEELLILIKPELVISFYSSALINIKLMGIDVKMLGFSPAKMKINRNGKEVSLRNFFSLFGVSLYEL